MSKFALETIDRNKLSDSIVDRIVEAIRAGDFPPGTAIPSERTLAQQLGVGRSSVREAVRVLDHAGVLDVRTGRGTFVTDASLSHAVMLRAHAALAGDNSPLDVIVARRGLEPVAAEAAAINRTRTDIDTMRRAISAQSVALERGEDPEEIDFSFHLALAAATHNPVLYSLVERVIDIMRQPAWRDLKHRSLVHAGGVSVLDQHRAILSAIEGSDAVRASAAMCEHLESIEAWLLDEVER